MRRKNIILVLGVLSLVLAGCVTTPTKEIATADSARATALKIADNLNNGKYTTLTKMSYIPFLFESEELKSDKLTSLVWQGLVKQGFQLDNPQVKSVVPTNAATYQSFDAGWEAKTFFEEYVRERGFLVTLTGSNGRTLLLVIGDYKGLSWITAMRVVQ